MNELHHRSLDPAVSKQSIYKQWASNYDDDVMQEGYRAPREAASELTTYFAKHLKPTEDQDLFVLDVGCGTGLAGEELFKLAGEQGQRVRVTGCDISADMIALAHKRGYEDCCQVDLNVPITWADDSFHGVMCTGTLIQGHVRPDPLLFELCRVVKPGGIALVSVRTTYFETEPSFAGLLERLEMAGHRVSTRNFQYLKGVTAMMVRIEVSPGSPDAIEAASEGAAVPQGLGLTLPRMVGVMELGKAMHRRMRLHPSSAILAPRPSRPGAMKVLDACCGFGDTGAVLQEWTATGRLPGYELDLYGLDMSPVVEREPSAYYQNVRQGDLAQPLWMYPDDEFDATICIGAFAEGSDVRPPALEELVRIVQPGGVIIASVEHRTDGPRDMPDFNEALARLEAAGHTVSETPVQSQGVAGGVKTHILCIEKAFMRPQPQEQQRTVGYLGVGRMGKPMVKALLAAGYRVQLHDRYPSDVEFFTSLGGEWKDTPREAAQGADFVVTNLPLPEHVYEAMTGADGGLAGMRKGAVWADFSTTDYHNTLRLAALAEKQGSHALECPVTNLHQLGVEVCNCAFFVGGEREHFQAVQADLETMGQKAFVCGSIGQAQTVKLVTNLTFYAGVALGTEALLAAQKAGIPPLSAWRYLQARRSVSAAFRHFLCNVMDGSLDGSCSLEVVHKDMNLTKELDREFRDKGSPHAAWRVMPGTNALFNAAAERYPVEGNHLLVSKHLAEINGTSLEVPGFTSPSHHGADKDYRIPAFHRDAVGRVQPFVPARVTDEGPDGFQPSPEQEALLQDLEEWLTFSNYACYLDAEALGLGFGLTPEYIHHLITWSVGCSWISDNLTTYSAPDTSSLFSKVDRFSEGLELPVTRSLVQAMRERGASQVDQRGAWTRPVVNLQTLSTPEPKRIRTLSARRLEAQDIRELARLRSSLEEHGVFWLDVPDADVGFKALQASPSFFHLPLSVKSRFSAEENAVYPKTSRGFTRTGLETLNPEEGPDWKETFDMGVIGQPLPSDPRALPFHGPTAMPSSEAPGFTEAAVAAQGLVLQQWLPSLVRSIDRAFEGGEGAELGPGMAEPTMVQRFLFYPKGSKAFAGRHTEQGVLSVLFAENPLPEVKDPKTGVWQAVSPSSRPLPLVFAGDLMRDWSNGSVLSLPHRVQHFFGDADRRSLAFYIYPNVNHTVQTLQGGVSRRAGDIMVENFVSVREDAAGAM